MMQYRWLNRLAWLATLLAFVVIVLGAYVRLSHAGLGCPDWPGCYGQLIAPDAPHEIASANADFERPVEPAKAWKEMVHRYFASFLGVLILALAVMAWRQRKRQDAPVKLSLFLVALVIFQGALGMWTVTLLLKPLIVTLHLLGGMATFALLLLLSLRTSGRLDGLPDVSAALRRFAALALAVLIIQIALGGWTSTNYAALACPDFPTCQAQWIPDMDFATGFTLWHGLGINYEGGILHHPARVAIHFTHRVGALVTFILISTLALLLFRQRHAVLRTLGGVVLALLLMQVSLGVSVVMLALPLPLAVMHNGTAALLLAAMVTLNFALTRQKRVR
ncbi:MAG TPA: COX15/CtaA family protein [Gammaproteobacteria bacterium]|nr:COX15/CtaA family protein [Gammaproteobacteria bacterium]